MKQVLKNRTKKLVDAVPANDLYQFTQLIYEFINERGEKIIEDFNTGDEVSFMKSKTTMTGTIVKINKNSAIVECPPDWRIEVPAYLLRKEKFLKE
jgi:uncharacterized protein YkvS